jgi:hypothetical protein
MSNDTNAELMQWWTPDGWVMKETPQAWRDRTRRETLRDAGYELQGYFIGDTRDPRTEMVIQVWYNIDQHLVGHLCCNIERDGKPLADFFVADEHHVEFYVDLLPCLMSGYRLC